MMDTSNKERIPVSTGKQTSEKSNWPTLQHPIAEMEHAFDRFFGRHWLSRQWGDFFPVDRTFEEEGLRIANLDLVDRDNEVFVRAEIPGVEKKDINISLTDNLLTIKGLTKHEKKEEQGDYHRHEISSSSFARTVMLPANVDSSKAVAQLKDGVLELTLPKVEISKHRNIEIM